LLSRAVRQAAKRNPFIAIRGYGDTSLQPLHVDDLAACVAPCFVRSPAELKPGTYGLAGYEQTSPLNLVDRFAARLRRPKLKVHVPLFILQFLALFSSSRTRVEEVPLTEGARAAGAPGAPERAGPGDRRGFIPLSERNRLLSTAFVAEKNDWALLAGGQSPRQLAQAEDEALQAAGLAER